MDLQKLAAWSAALDAALASDEETDLQALWDEVSAAIAANPDAPALRRLRARMADATAMHACRHEDLVALRRLDPADRQAWLDLALLQHRWAFLLVDDEDENEAPGENDDGKDEENLTVSITVRAPQSETDSAEGRLEQEALGWLAQMLREHAGDAAFCRKVFDGWEKGHIHAPWLRLTLALEACAAHPGDNELERVLALAWTDLANQAPEELDLENAPPPMGFMFDVEGTLWDPFLQERALAALAPLLARHPQVADLLACRARLLRARCNFPAAAEAFARAADAAAQMADAEPEAEAREFARQLESELRAQGERCAGGREALATAMLDSLSDAIAQLQQPMPLSHNAGEAGRAFAVDWAQSMREHSDEMEGHLQAMRQAQPAAGPGEEQRAQMQALAGQLAAGILGSVQLAPLTAHPVAPAAFEQDWAGALQAPLSALAALGWTDLGWVEWPEFRALLGGQAVSSVWIDTARMTAALVSCVSGKPLVDLETELEGGPMVVTSMSRGRNFLTGGPEVDTLFIEPQLSVADAVALHAARVRLAMASGPALQAVPCNDLAGVLAAQERARARKTQFRLEEGLTESEALSVPSDYPELFAPMLRAAVRQGVDVLAGRR